MAGVTADNDLKGIIPRAFEQIFGFIEEADENVRYLVRCSYLEIYMENILDLLGNSIDKKLDVKQDPKKGIYVKDLTHIIVKSISEIQNAMDAGNRKRKTGETAMNKESSRSHSIFTIYIENS